MKGDSPARCEKRQALSTGQAARLCFVTPESILNWIRTKRLRAQRTAGGQYRIPVGDLRAFMLENGMDTGALECETGERLYCWEFHGREAARYGLLSQEVCEGCLVRRAAALHCWELHGLLPMTRRKFDACEDCPYYGLRENAETSVREG